MSSTQRLHHTSSRTPATRHLRLAWVFVGLIPVAFVGAMILGEGLLDAAGYSVDDVVPFRVALTAGGPALLLMVAPTVGAVWFGLRARREGLRNGFVPAVVGATVAVGAITANVGSYVLGRILG